VWGGERKIFQVRYSTKMAATVAILKNGFWMITEETLNELM
jgi:hypothetical protein